MYNIEISKETRNQAIAYASSVINLFEEYGYKTEVLAINSYIAYNDFLCVTFSVYRNGEYTAIPAVSFLSDDREKIVKRWHAYNSNQGRYPINIGDYYFSEFMNGKLPGLMYGPFCNHDYSLFEIESNLKRMKG